MQRDDRIRLQHVAEALDAAIGFAQGRQRSDLETDRMLLFALIHAVQNGSSFVAQVRIAVRQNS